MKRIIFGLIVVGALLWVGFKYSPLAEPAAKVLHFSVQTEFEFPQKEYFYSDLLQTTPLQDGTQQIVVSTLSLKDPGGPTALFLLQKNSGSPFKDVSATQLKVRQPFHVRQITEGDLNRDGQPDLILTDHGPDKSTFPGEFPHFLLRSGPDLQESQKLVPYEKADFNFMSVLFDFKQEKPLLLITKVQDQQSLAGFSYVSSKWVKEDLPAAFPKSGCYMTVKKFESLILLGGCDRQPSTSPAPVDLVLKMNSTEWQAFPLPPRAQDQSWGTVDAIALDINQDGQTDVIRSLHNFGFSQAKIVAAKAVQTPQGLHFEEWNLPLYEQEESTTSFIPWIHSFHFKDRTFLVWTVRDSYKEGRQHSPRYPLHLVEFLKGGHVHDWTKQLPEELQREGLSVYPQKESTIGAQRSNQILYLLTGTGRLMTLKIEE